MEEVEITTEQWLKTQEDNYRYYMAMIDEFGELYQIENAFNYLSKVVKLRKKLIIKNHCK